MNHNKKNLMNLFPLFYINTKVVTNRLEEVLQLEGLPTYFPALQRTNQKRNKRVPAVASLS